MKLWAVLTRLSHILVERNNTGCVSEPALVNERVRVCEDESVRFGSVCVCVFHPTPPFTAGAEPNIQAAQ